MNIPLPTNEDDRLSALHEYAVLDTPPEAAFERITNLAARLFDVPIALVSLVDRDRQWFKSCYGLDTRQTGRELSFCAHAILTDEVMVVPDAAQDARFAANALVTGEPGIRFYAGAPLKTHTGFKLGTLCIIDTVPRQLSDEQRATLTDLAAMAVDALELRLAADTLRQEMAQSLQQQEALQAAEARTQQIVETAHNAFVSMDAEGLITGWNGRAETIFGWPREEAIGRPLAETIIPPAFHEAHWRGLKRFLETGQGPVLNRIFEIRAMRRDGTEFPVELSISPLRWGESYVFTAFVRDISERKASEEALARQTVAFQEQAQLLDLAHDTILVIDFDGTIRFWNKSAERAYGWSAAEALGQNSHRLLRSQLPQPLEEVKEMLLRDGLWEGEAIHVSRDGTALSVSTRWVLKRDEKGRATQILKISNDITARKVAEAELQESRRFAESIADQSASIIYVLDLETRTFVYTNRDAVALLGYSPEEMQAAGSDFLVDTVHPDDRAFAQSHFDDFGRMSDEDMIEFEQRLRHVDGRWFTLLHRERVFKRRPDGTPQQIMGTAIDITQRKAAEAALQQERAFLKVLLESTHEGIVACDAEGVLTLFNRATREFHGLPQDEIEAQSLRAERWAQHFDLYHADGQTLMKKEEVPLFRALHGEIVRDVEMVIATKNGTPRSLLANGQALLDADGRKLGAVVTMHDITERKQAEAKLQQAHDELEARVARRTAQLARANEELHQTSDRLQAITDNTTSVIYLKDLQGRYLLANRRFEALFNVTREQLIGKTDHDLFPSDMANVFAANDQKVLAVNDVLELEEEAPQADGLHTYISIKFPLRDSEGRVYAMGGISTDITERKRAEVALQAAKEEAERANAAKSELLSRTSHELRTPLNAILGFGQLLQLDDLDEEQSRSVEQILKAGRHQLELVDRVLDVARLETGKLEIALEPVAVGEALREAFALVLPLAAAQDVRLNLDDSADRHTRSRVLADRARLAQVLLNLLSNAVKYNHEGGSVTVSVAEVEDRNRLRVAVSDTGSGLTPDAMGRLFRLFDRIGAEEAGVAGTGIGLTLSKGLVEAMGGEIGVQSTLGAGSTFWIELPRATDDETAEVEPAMSLETTPDAAPETHAVVLYIEDNLSNLNLVQHILRHRPEVRLLTAMQGGLGLELAREHRPDLILLDLHLPDIQGDEVLRQLQNEPATRAIPVVMLSADAMPRQIEQLRAAGARAYLTKPLDVKRFLQVLDEELGDSLAKGQTDDV